MAVSMLPSDERVSLAACTVLNRTAFAGSSNSSDEPASDSEERPIGFKGRGLGRHGRIPLMPRLMQWFDPVSVCAAGPTAAGTEL
jgi:hypothetical protein